MWELRDTHIGQIFCRSVLGNREPLSSIDLLSFRIFSKANDYLSFKRVRSGLPDSKKKEQITEQIRYKQPKTFFSFGRLTVPLYNNQQKPLAEGNYRQRLLLLLR